MKIREYVDGSDLETLMKNPSLCPSLRSPEERIKIAVGIAKVRKIFINVNVAQHNHFKGLSYLHNLRTPIVHGDFKPSDILVPANTKNPRITNFGLWDFKNFFIENTMSEDAVFLNPHQAPEVLIGRERPTLCSDVWSLGCIILQWMLERAPWDLTQLCEQYQYRHDRQATALYDAMDNQVS